MADAIDCARCPATTERRGVRWPEGFVCRRCYQQATRRRGTCPECHTADRLLPGLDAQHRPICTDCAGIDDPRLTCTGCGDQDEPHRRGFCARCCLATDLTALFTAPGADDVTEQLRPLFDALIAQPHARSALVWMNKPHVHDLLTGLADGRYPITHDTFTDHPSPRTARHMRDLLVRCGILPTYDRQLDRFTTWLDVTLTTDQVHQSLDVVRRFATWKHLRTLRGRAEKHPLTEGAVRNARQEMAVTIEFVNWLHQRRTALTDTTQADIDTWLATGPTTRSAAMMFTKWCTTHRHIDATIEFPRRQARTSPITADTERYTHLAAAIADTSTPPWLRAASVLLLSCAQPITRIAALPLDALTTTDDGCLTIKFSDHHTTIPTPLADPITDLIHQRPNMTTAANSGTSPWLFPGRTPGHHIHAQTLMHALQARGINLIGARNSAMRELIRSIPAAIVATQFGYTPRTTERHALTNGTAWSSYPGLHQDAMR